MRKIFILSVILIAGLGACQTKLDDEPPAGDLESLKLNYPLYQILQPVVQNIRPQMKILLTIWMCYYLMLKKSLFVGVLPSK